jgi:hypothetical protein
VGQVSPAKHSADWSSLTHFTPDLLLQIPKVLLSGDSLSASAGGYHASAGLGGTLDGGPAGGLFAEAGTPDGTGASAGLGGSAGSGGVLYSQAGAAGAASSAGTDNRLPRPTKRPADFYDNVFNVSTSRAWPVHNAILSVQDSF